VRVDDVFEFAKERHSIYLRRAAGVTPLTTDPILAKYRFCNIYRELDTVTDWLRRSWREPHADDPDLWFAFVVARHMNNIDFMEGMDGPPLPWEPERFKRYAARRQRAGLKVFSAAYMIGTRHTGSKTDYLADMVFTPLWEQRERIRPLPGDTLNSFHMMLGQFYGLASFMAAQVVADIKYTEPLLSAADWQSFAASGPGSRRGLNRVLGRPVRSPWSEDDWRLRLGDLRAELLPRFLALGWELPHAQDVQNTLCEFDKMERARLGEGRPKQIFRG
jgi:hypothetical protein